MFYRAWRVHFFRRVSRSLLSCKSDIRISQTEKGRKGEGNFLSRRTWFRFSFFGLFHPSDSLRDSPLLPPFSASARKFLYFYYAPIPFPPPFLLPYPSPRSDRAFVFRRARVVSLPSSDRRFLLHCALPMPPSRATPFSLISP